MRLRLVLLAVFIGVSVIEIALFVIVGEQIGVAATIGIVLATAVLGSWLVARQGRSTWVKLRTELAAGEVPTTTAAHGGMILVAGALLLTPGFLTDAIGFALMIPLVRDRIRLAVAGRYRNRWTIVP